MIRREPAGEAVWADVPEIGMNIAEQLYRLERRKDNRHFLPTDSFGWRFSEEMEMEDQFRVAVGLTLFSVEFIINVRLQLANERICACGVLRVLENYRCRSHGI